MAADLTWDDVQILREQTWLAWEERNERIREEIRELRYLIDDPTTQEAGLCSSHSIYY